MESIVVSKIHKKYEKLTRKDVFYSLYGQDAFCEVNRQKMRPIGIVTYKDNHLRLKEYTITFHDIWKQCLGIDFERETLRTDNGDIIAMNRIVAAFCTLKKVTSNPKYTINEVSIKHIRTFYMENYFVETATDNEHQRKVAYPISLLLYKLNLIHKGRKPFHEWYYISNRYQHLQNFQRGLFPKDLFYPIKLLNGMLYGDEYHVRNFQVQGDITVTQ